MFCPRCSQQQFPEEVRFCNRCGFQLAAVSQLLRTDGAAFIQTKERLPLIKRQELRNGAKLIFLSFFSVVPSFILAVIVDHGIPLVVPFITFLVGLAQMLYYFLFGESILPMKKQSSEFNDYQPQINYPPTQNLPFSVVDSKPINTDDFSQPFSRNTNYLNNK
jgi:hypothetical protein